MDGKPAGGGVECGHPDYAQKEKTVLISLIVDLLLWVPDIVAAVLSGSITLFADVIKCGNEIIATFLSYITLRKLSRGGAGVYDYGMGKFENLTGLITGGVMLISLIMVFFAALYRIAFPASLVAEGTYLGIGLMVLGVCTNSALWFRNYRVWQKDPSPIMDSQWRLFRAKAFSDGSVLVALIATMALEQYLWSRYIDPLASFVIVGFLLFSGYRVISTALPDLLDKTLDEELQLIIMRELAAFYHDYAALHGVRSRRSGTGIYVEIFLEFDGEKKMSEVQAVVDRMTRSLEARIPRTSVSIVLSTTPPRNPAPTVTAGHGGA